MSVEKILNSQLLSEIDRLEIINHNKNRFPEGRLIAIYKDKDFSEISYDIQDDGKTLKIFLK